MWWTVLLLACGHVVATSNGVALLLACGHVVTASNGVGAAFGQQQGQVWALHDEALAPKELARRKANLRQGLFLRGFVSRVHSALRARKPRERIARPEGGGAKAARGADGAPLPTIAIGLSVTSRGQSEGEGFDFVRLPLFAAFLPSFVATAERGFEYWLYMGFDVGDEVFDSDWTRDNIDRWLRQHIAAPLLRDKGIVVRWATLRFANPLGKPGPVINFVMAAAHADGAQYLSHVNDDMVLLTPWTGAAVRALRARAPANIGVVGPSCARGCRHASTATLVQDVVHRTHLVIFSTYYPLVFTDWYADEWISMVYGASYTTQLRGVEVEHWQGPASGQLGAVAGAGDSGSGGGGSSDQVARFAPDLTHQRYVPSEVKHGHRKVLTYVKKYLISEIRGMGEQ